MWTGALLGAVYLLATLILIRRLGTATTIGMVLAGQVAASTVIGHFSLIRVPVQVLSVLRLLGAGLIIAGVALVQRF